MQNFELFFIKDDTGKFKTLKATHLHLVYKVSYTLRDRARRQHQTATPIAIIRTRTNAMIITASTKFSAPFHSAVTHRITNYLHVMEVVLNSSPGREISI